MWTTYEAHMNKEKKAALMLKHDWVPIPDYGDLMTMREWIKCVESGGFIDYDGFGLYAFKDICFRNTQVMPSDVKKGKIDKSFTHIVWYNK